MSDLLARIRAMQIDAGERAVMEDLKAKGFDEHKLAAIVEAGTRRPTAVEIHKEATARALKALELRRQGLTFKAIGQQVGKDGRPVTVERARCLVKKGERIEQRRALSASGATDAER